ncbi:metallophosphoesterase [Desulfosoma caldarium]|uniref:Calcineurin-like phosphoesterase domain-containing protein n=1 Tax=Desulfosoma caldarium TaxID=610254 RepID=A0A3N1US53_9BACT|nr:metallophosphoesterase [Desulfosoma caldarium]ROQ89916.1 hypothetical protein EDC27_3035 [Desulfosoma caldarium]
MKTFLLVFLTVYSTMHAVFLYRVHGLFEGRQGWWAAFLVFCAFMVLAPILCRVLERTGWEVPARLVAYVGYPWMGFLFLAFWLSLLVGAVNGLLWLLHRFSGLGTAGLSGKPTALGVILVAAVVSLYAAWEAHDVRIERVRLHTDKLPPHVPRLVVAQISDVHLGLNGRQALSERIVRTLRHIAPDLVVSTGDLVDGRTHALEPLLPLWQDLQPPLGKVAIVGNHEYYVGLQDAMDWTRRAGFVLLRDEATTLAGLVNVVGVDDSWKDRPETESRLLQSAANGLLTLYLKHRPQICPETLGLFDLQLSGHTHRGQIFPFTLFVALMYPFFNGTYELEKGSALHTSRGTGTWGPPMRLLAPPEITVLEFVRRE